MTDDAQPQVTAPADTPPAPAPAKAPEIPADIQALLDSRVAGVQSSLEKRFNEELRRRDALIEQLQSANLSEEEREKLASDERDDELESLRTQLWLEKQAQKNPKAAEVYRKLLESDDDDTAFGLLSELVSATPAAPAPVEPADQVPDVDPNNPPVTPVNEEFVTLPNGQTMSESQVDQFFKDLRSWPEQ